VPTANPHIRGRASCALSWLPALNLSAAAFPARPLGCPPTPALCRPAHVYAHVVVVGMRRAASRARRMAAQLDALRVPFTLVDAVDAASLAPDAAVLFEGRGATALYHTQRALLGAFAASRAATLLVLEDDATLAADFEVAFDGFARALPADWRFHHLGASIWHNSCDAATLAERGVRDAIVRNGVPLLLAPGVARLWALGGPSFPPEGPRCAKAVYGSFAFAVDRAAAALAAEVLAREMLPIDTVRVCDRVGALAERESDRVARARGLEPLRLAHRRGRDARERFRAGDCVGAVVHARGVALRLPRAGVCGGADGRAGGGVRGGGRP